MSQGVQGQLRLNVVQRRTLAVASLLGRSAVQEGRTTGIGYMTASVLADAIIATLPPCPYPPLGATLKKAFPSKPPWDIIIRCTHSRSDPPPPPHCWSYDHGTEMPCP